MMRNQKKQKKNSIKKTIQQGIMIFIVVILLVAVAFTASLYLFTKDEYGKIVYPASPLTKMIDETHAYIGDSSLDISIQCPSIPVIMSVGGTERGVSEHGCVFRYSSDLSISVYEMTGTAYDILSTEFAANLYNGEISGSAEYVADTGTMDIGYFNGYPAEYQCGVINILSSEDYISKKIYVVTLMLDMGFEKKVMITVSTEKTDSLYDAELLLESIGYTLMDISLTENSLDNSYQYDASGAEDTSEIPTISYEIEDNSVSKIGTSDVIIEIPLVRNYESGAVVVLTYTALDADISQLSLKSPYSAESITADNHSIAGIAYFVIENAVRGNWELKVPSGMDLGTYTAVVMDSVECYTQYGFDPLSVDAQLDDGVKEEIESSQEEEVQE